MLDFLNSVPENLGWTLVGFMLCLVLVMAILNIRLFIQMRREAAEACAELDEPEAEVLD